MPKFHYLLLGLTIVSSTAQAAPPTLKSVPLYEQVAPRIPDADAEKLIEMATGIIEAFEDGAVFNPVGNAFQPEPLSELLAAPIAITRAIEKGTDNDRARVLLARAFYQLSLVPRSFYVLVGLDDLGLPPVPGLPEAQKPLVEAYLGTLKRLGPLADAKIPGLVEPLLEKEPKNADALRVLARHYAMRFQLAKAIPLYERLIAVSRLARDHFEAARYRAYKMSDAETKKLLSGLVARYPYDAWRRFAVTRWQEVGRALDAATQAVAQEDSQANRTQLVQTAVRYYGGGSEGSYTIIADAEKAFPSSGDIRVSRGVWFLGGGSVEAATQVMNELDTTGLPVTGNHAIGSRMTLRFSQLYSMVTQGRLGEVAPLLEVIEADQRAFKGDDDFPGYMVGFYVGILRQMLDDKVLAKVLRGDDVDTDSIMKRVHTITSRALKRVNKKYKSRLDVWKQQLLVDMLGDSEKTIAGLDRFIARMDKAVRASDSSDAALFGAMALTIAGRRPDGLKRLRAAHDRLVSALERFDEHDDKISNDKKLKLPECPNDSCMDRGRAWAYLGGVRNMLRQHIPDAEQAQWDIDTTVTMRKAERFLADAGSSGSSLHAQIMTHRCWAQQRLPDVDAAHQCIRDLLSKHRYHPEVRHIYAAMIANDPQRQPEAARLFTGISQDRSVAAGLRYDALKWLALFALGSGDQTQVEQAVKRALDERKDAFRFGQSLDYAAFVADGAFNVGLGFGADGLPVHQVSAIIDLWSIVRAPIDDSKMESVLGGNAPNGGLPD